MIETLCSVLIPVYNGERFIERTIKSCLDQSVNSNIEIIVIDDFSSDSSFDIIQNLATTHSNITALRNDNNSGINKSVNHAASLAKGKYIMFLGHDDMLQPKHIENIIQVFDGTTSFVHCNSDLIDKDDNIIGVGVNDEKQARRTKLIRYYLALGNAVHSTGTIIRKKYFDEVGGWDEQYKNYGEWLLWTKLSSVGKVKYSTKTKALYRRHDTNITNTFSDKNIRPELLSYYQKCQETALSKLKNPLVKVLLIALINLKKVYKKVIQNRIK